MKYSDLLNGVKRLDLPSCEDARGILTAIEGGIDIPFEIKRIFYMHHIVADRAAHAHRETDQVVIGAAGSSMMDISDGVTTHTYQLTDPATGLYIPRMLFVRIYDLSPDALILVLANTHYDISKSIRSWDEYLDARKLSSTSADMTTHA